MEAPAAITTGKPGEAPAAELEIIDDTPEKPSADLRKFNKAAAEVAKVLNPLKLILKISDMAGVDSALEKAKLAKKAETLIENKRKDLVAPWNAEVKRINAHAADLVKGVDPEINRVKSLVLTFQLDEEKRLKRERTTARNTQLLSLAMTPVTIEKDGKKVISSWTNDQKQIITQFQVDETPEDQWAVLLFNQATERVEKAVDDLKKEEKAAAFFGEDTTDLVAKAAEVKAAPAPASFSTGGSFTATKIKGATKTWTYETLDLSQVPREYLQLDEVKIRQAIAAGTRSIAGLNIYQKDSISLR